MKKDEVKVGGVYAAKVSGKIVPVHIAGESPHGGWDGTNINTGKAVRIKSAQRLRGLWQQDLAAPEAHTGPQGEEEAESEPKANKTKKRGTRANTGDDGARMSGLDAAAKVLEEAGEPLSCKTIVQRAFETGYWQSEGKTPAATIYAAILREIQKKGEDARFRKVERGKFAFAG